MDAESVARLGRAYAEHMHAVQFLGNLKKCRLLFTYL